MRYALALTILAIFQASVVVMAHLNDVPGTPGWSPKDFSGTYEEGDQPSKCSITRRHSSGAAVYIAQSNETITMRVLSSGHIRLLHIERGQSAIGNTRKRNGLARWDGDELVVETAAPAFPLLGRFGAVAPGGSLIERFARTVDHLIYRTWLTPTPEAESLGPVEVRLARCRPND